MQFSHLSFKKQGLSDETLEKIDNFISELRKELRNEVHVEAVVSASRDKVTIKISKED